MTYKLLQKPSMRKTVLQYLTTDSVILDLPFIITMNKKLNIGMPYLLLDKSGLETHIMAVRLVDINIVDECLYINVIKLENNKRFNLSWNLNYTGDFWLWSLSDIDYLSEVI